MTDTNAILQLFERTGAYLRGHFRLTSGMHSPEYLQCARVLAHPEYAEELGTLLAEAVRSLAPGRAPGVVVAPALWRRDHRARSGARAGRAVPLH